MDARARFRQAWRNVRLLPQHDIDPDDLLNWVNKSSGMPLDTMQLVALQCWLDSEKRPASWRNGTRKLMFSIRKKRLQGWLITEPWRMQA